MEKTVAAAAVVLVIIVVAVVAAYLWSAGNHAPSTVTSSIPVTSTILVNTTTVIGGNNNYASGCSGTSGYNCSAGNISTYGQVSFSLTQNSANTLYNVHIACGVLNTNGILANASSWYALTNTGTTKPANFSGTSLAPGTAKSISNLQCYDQAGAPISVSTGQTYAGVVLLEYTNSSAGAGAGNPWIDATVATVNFNTTSS